MVFVACTLFIHIYFGSKTSWQDITLVDLGMDERTTLKRILEIDCGCASRTEITGV